MLGDDIARAGIPHPPWGPFGTDPTPVPIPRAVRTTDDLVAYAKQITQQLSASLRRLPTHSPTLTLIDQQLADSPARIIELTLHDELLALEERLARLGPG